MDCARRPSVEEPADVVVQRALVGFQRQSVIAALIDDLLDDVTLAIHRIGGHDRAFEAQHLEQTSGPR